MVYHIGRTSPGAAVEMALAVDVGEMGELAEALARLTDPAQQDSIGPFGGGELLLAVGIRQPTYVPRLV